MEPTSELIDALYREKVLRARRMTLQKRVEVGAALSDIGRQMMRDAIRRENPSASEEEVRQLMRRRLELKRKLDDTPLPESGSLK
ncbi:MAG: hypothetical protein ABSB74_07850 [Tepidisphaeraceae bacterium]